MLVFTSQFRILIVRERRHFWCSRPGKELTISSVATIVGFLILGVWGIIVPALTPVEVLVALVFSAIFTLGVDFPKFYTFRRFGL
jgi:H+-transporting ATPase